MAANSAVVMPLKQCCLERIGKLPVSSDNEGNVIVCPKCGVIIEFTDNAWRETYDN